MTNKIVIILFLFVIFSCSKNIDNISKAKPSSYDKIPVLNLGTFHFGYTSDATQTEFDEHNKKNIKEVHQIAKSLAEFKPTIILVESEPKYNEELQSNYTSYMQNPKIKFDNPTEVELLAFEVGRLSNTKKIYGIDHQMGYNYGIGFTIDNTIDKHWHDKYYNNYMQSSKNEEKNKFNLLDKLRKGNSAEELNNLIVLNADMLTHAGTDGNFEGADEAAKLYQRNLRMYSEMNRIDIQPSDRVFILMGGTHTAFFRDFINRSPKYKLVNTFSYLR